MATGSFASSRAPSTPGSPVRKTRAARRVGGGLPPLANQVVASGKVERVDPEPAILASGNSNANAVALHHAAKIGRDHSKQIAEVQRRDQSIRQVQQEFQAFLGAPRRLKIDGIVHGERDLVGNQRKELYLVL